MLLVRPVTIDDTVLAASSVPEREAVWSVLTTYAAGAQVRAAASGANAHRLFESVVGSNLGHDPATDGGANWLDLGLTNRWTMFDASPQSQTTAADAITVSLAVAGRADVLTVQNVSASALSVTATDDVDGVVYSADVDLVDDEGIDDWLAWFVEPIERKTEVTLTDLPKTYSGLQFDVSLTAAGEDVACGLCLLGQSAYLGGTRWGGRDSIRDYSTKSVNDFGEADIVERAFAKLGEFDAVMTDSQANKAKRILATFRATKVLLVAAADQAIYGFINDWSIERIAPRYRMLSIQFEGLA
jgi:hypothetical protein